MPDFQSEPNNAPLRFIIPAVILVSGLLTVVGITLLLVRISDDRTDQLVSELVSVIGVNTAGDILAGLRNDDSARIRNGMEQLQSIRNLKISLLVNGTGQIVFASRRDWVGQTLRASGDDALETLFHQAGLDRLPIQQTIGERLYYAAPVSALDSSNRSGSQEDHVLLIVYDFVRINADHRRTAWGLAGLAAVLVLGISLLSWIVLNRALLDRLNQLVSASTRIGEGDLETPVPSWRNDEIGALGQALDYMRRQLMDTKKRTEAGLRLQQELTERLRQEERRLRLIIENLPDMVVTVDERGVLMWFDRSSEQWRSLSTAETAGGWSNAFGFHEIDGVTPIEEERSPLRRAFGGEQIQGDEMCVLQGGHDPKFVSVRGGPIHSPRGERSGAVVVLHNVTEQRRASRQIAEALREKETLLKEIHHRVKNNLQIVSSLLDMQSSAERNPLLSDSLRESVNRIRSMSMIHERLYRGPNLALISLGDYVESLAHAVFSTYDVRNHSTLTVYSDEINLNADTVAPCGLILNELVSNACKYAFSGEKVGTLDVRISREVTGMIRMEVEDNGPGLPVDFELRRSRSLGLQLVETLTHQLRGKLTIASTPGARFCLEFMDPSLARIQPD